MMDVYLYFGACGQRPAEVASLQGGYNGDRLRTTRVRVEPGVKYHVVVTAAAAGMQGAFAVTACGVGVQLKACPLIRPPPQYAAAMAAIGEFLLDPSARLRTAPPRGLSCCHPECLTLMPPLGVWDLDSMWALGMRGELAADARRR